MEDQDDDRLDSRSLPIYKKGEEIYDLVEKIADLIDSYDNPILKETKGFMLLDASRLTIKVAGAEGGDLYDIRMEAAAIIRKAARDLILHVHTLNTFGFKETHFYDLVREAVEEYRILFIEWVASFDKWNYTIDRWGYLTLLVLAPMTKIPMTIFPLILTHCSNSVIGFWSLLWTKHFVHFANFDVVVHESVLGEV